MAYNVIYEIISKLVRRELKMAHVDIYRWRIRGASAAPRADAGAPNFFSTDIWWEGYSWAAPPGPLYLTRTRPNACFARESDSPFCI